MDVYQLQKKAETIKDKYHDINPRQKQWGAREYAQGLVTDLGELMELLMAKDQLRFDREPTEEAIAQELSDCLWSLLIIAQTLDIDLEEAFLKSMDTLAERIDKKSINNYSMPG